MLVFGPAVIFISMTLFMTRSCEHKFETLENYGTITSFNFTDVFYTDSISTTTLYVNSKERSDLVSVTPHSHSKFVLFHSLPISLRSMIFTNAILTLLFFVMIMYHLKSFVFKIIKSNFSTHRTSYLGLDDEKRVFARCFWRYSARRF